MERAQNHVFDSEFEMVTEVVEPEFVIGAVGDVGFVCILSSCVVDIGGDNSDGESEELVDSPHPLSVPLGEVVVDGDDMDTFSVEGIERSSKGSDKRFSFAGFHFCDVAMMKSHSPDKLDIEVPHIEGSF